MDGKGRSRSFWILLGILKPSNEGRASAPQHLALSDQNFLPLPSGESAEIELWSWL